MEEYKRLIKKDMVRVEEYKKKADNSWWDAQQANLLSDNYSLYAVVFSMVMFLGAIASKASNTRISFVFIALSGLVCIAALTSMFISMPLASK